MSEQFLQNELRRLDQALARIAELEAERDDLNAGRRTLAAVVDNLRAERDRLKAALTEIAGQHTAKEREESDEDEGDLEFAYDEAIRLCRAAISPAPSVKP